MNATRMRMDKRGRAVLPVAVRRAQGLKTGDEMILNCDEFGLVIKPNKRKEKETKT